MESRFGIKDLVSLLLLLGIGVTLWLGLFQEDRRFAIMRDVQTHVLQQGSQLADLRDAVETAGENDATLLAIAEAQRSNTHALAALSARLDLFGARIESALAASHADAEALQQKLAEIEQAARETLAPDAAAAPSRDESWARAGIPVDWQPDWGFRTDPRELPGFRMGGSFTEIFEAQPAKLTPYIQTDVYGRRVVDLVVQTLGAYDPVSLKLRGVLAQAWQYDPDGMWLRIRLHPRARFSDGKPVTSEDVRWTFHDFVMNPQIESERARSILRDVIDRIEVIDARTFEVVFKDAFFSNLDSALTLFILPSHVYSAFTPKQINESTGLLVGSGPFRLESFDLNNQWSPGKPVDLVRSEQYWLAKSPLARVRFLAINDEQARLTAYRNNEGSMITPASTQFQSLVGDGSSDFARNNQCLNWVNMRSGNSFIAWNCGERNGKLTPFHDRRVRLAMTHLLDREKMIRDIWKGVGVVSKGSFLPSSPGSNPNFGPWPFDLERAKALLKEAGWEDRNANGVLENPQGDEFVFEFTYFAGGEIAERIALFVKDAAAAAGIRCEPRGVDWSVGEPIRQKRDFDAITLGWGANAPESDPKQIYHSDSIANQGDNFAQWRSEEADRLIDAGRKELDFEKRMALWHEFERVIHEEQPYTWVRVSPFLRFVKPEFRNVNTYPKGLEHWEFFSGGSAGPSN